MGYKIGQLRKPDMTSGNIAPFDSMTDNSVATTDGLSPNSYGVGPSDFKDIRIICNNSGSQITFSKNSVYMLRFKVRKIFGSQGDYGTIKFKVLLKAGNSLQTQASHPPEEIGSGEVLKALDGTGQTEEYCSFEYVFSPTQNTFDTIILRVDRLGTEVLNSVRDWMIQLTGVNLKNFSLLSFGTLNNLKTTTSNWLKLGFQSRPGTLIVVNKEPIRVGRGGIYELDKTSISSFSIAEVDTASISPFLLDYLYQDSGN